MAENKCYPFNGVITRPAIKKDKNGHEWIEFRLHRDGQTGLPCRAFNDKAEKIIDGYNEGDEIRIVGRFDSFIFQRRSGEQGSINYVHIVKVGWGQAEEIS